MNPLTIFEDFLSISRPSGNEQKICDYLCHFAEEHNLEYNADKFYNVIIKRKSNNGSNGTIILQGHTDMVCMSENNYDFDSQGIDWYIEDGYYKARGTTLGADNGIGCSIILAILGNDELKVPNIEAVFTTQEETTMAGAKNFDYSQLKGNKLISIDGTTEGVIDVSCAGMASIRVSKRIAYEPQEKKTYELKISRLKGGHSGTDINKNRGNAIKIVGDILHNISDIQLVTIKGGSKENVIPSTCECVFTSNESIIISDKYKKQYPSIDIELNETDTCLKAISLNDTKIILDFIYKLPFEVLTYYQDKPQTSLNLGVIDVDDETINIDISIRSSKKEEEDKYIKEVANLATNLDFQLVDRKPFFSFVENSFLRDKLVETYEIMYNKKVVLEHVHAGLEGGIFKEHLKNLDICVISPNIYDIHSVKERVEIASVKRVYDWLVEILKEL